MSGAVGELFRWAGGVRSGAGFGFEGLEPRTQAMQLQLDSADPPQHFIDLAKQVFVLQPRYIERAAGYAPVADTALHLGVTAVHASSKSMRCAMGSRFPFVPRSRRLRRKIQEIEGFSRFADPPIPDWRFND